MRIACPTCDATYKVPDALIGAGRRLRCAKCAHEWLAQAGSPAAPGLPPAATPLVADAVPPPVSEPVLPVPAPPLPQAAAGSIPGPIPGPIPQPIPGQPGGRGAVLALWAAWIGSGLLLAAAGAGAWIYRAPIIEVWPPAARAYLLFGPI